MSSMRILHLSSERTWRGGEQQIAYLIEASQAQGIEVFVAVRSGSAFEKWCDDKGVHTFPLGFSSGIDIRSAFALKKIAKKCDAHIIHVHSGKAMSITHLSVLLGMKVPVVVHRRVDFPIKSRGLSRRKYAHKSVKQIICVSDAIATIAKQTVSRPEIVKTIHSGIDFSRFSDKPKSFYIHDAYGLDRKFKLVANVSAVAPHKDYPTFLRTAARILSSQHDVHFLIVGDGKLMVQIKDLAMQLGIEKHITFTGFRKDIPDLLRELDVFLITSETEGLGTTIIDAMYNHIPVVATAAGGIPELVQDGVTGFLCPVKDVNALADRVVRLLEKPELAAAFGQNAMKKALNFSKEIMASKILHIYREVLEERQVN